MGTSYAERRIKKLRRERIYNPETCASCGGSGIQFGKTKKDKYWGCATCAVKTVMGVRLSVKEFNWLCKEALK